MGFALALTLTLVTIDYWPYMVAFLFNLNIYGEPPGKPEWIQRGAAPPCCKTRTEQRGKQDSWVVLQEFDIWYRLDQRLFKRNETYIPMQLAFFLLDFVMVNFL